MRLRFVTAEHGNYHMTELLAGICAAARDAGHDAALESAGFPPMDHDTVCVVVPHEFYGCEPADTWPSAEQRARTIVLFVENPCTLWFDQACRLAPHFASVLAINRSSLAELRRRGVDAQHLQLGYTRHWDAWQGGDGHRPIDITYLGATDRRRDAFVAGYGRWFWHRQTAMLVPRLAPKPSAQADYIVDQDKFAHLARAKLLLNLHREDSWSFEWVRALQAIANGCVVVSEPSVDDAPLVAGEHFVVAAPESIPHVANRLLDDPDRLAAIRSCAYELVCNELRMAPAIDRLVATAEDLVCGRSPRVLSPDGAAPLPTEADSPPAGRPDDLARLGAAVRNLTTDVLDLRRAVHRLAERSEGRDPDAGPEVLACTPTYADARPRASVAITLYNYEREVLDALRSVAASEFEDYEVLVLDDASADASRDAVLQFITDHPWLPLALLRHRLNKGLGASRNALARAARGELMFVLDADNTIYPTALGRLVQALDADPAASFAYPLLAVTCADQAIELLSRHAWDPGGFRAGNYIDAMALIRLDDLLALGGYTEDPRLTGWEDFHLWCRCAEADRRGRLVPEILARYRKAGHSMLAWSQTDASMAWSLMHARFPTLLGLAPGR